MKATCTLLYSVSVVQSMTLQMRVIEQYVHLVNFGTEYWLGGSHMVYDKESKRFSETNICLRSNQGTPLFS